MICGSLGRELVLATWSLRVETGSGVDKVVTGEVEAWAKSYRGREARLKL